jgi:hypothetical protein
MLRSGAWAVGAPTKTPTRSAPALPGVCRMQWWSPCSPALPSAPPPPSSSLGLGVAGGVTASNLHTSTAPSVAVPGLAPTPYAPTFLTTLNAGSSGTAGAALPFTATSLNVPWWGTPQNTASQLAFYLNGGTQQQTFSISMAFRAPASVSGGATGLLEHTEGGSPTGLGGFGYNRPATCTIQTSAALDIMSACCGPGLYRTGTSCTPCPCGTCQQLPPARCQPGHCWREHPCWLWRVLQGGRHWQGGSHRGSGSGRDTGQGADGGQEERCTKL